jgi:hypothetical protein
MPQHDTTAVAETVAQSPAPRRERDPRIDAFRGAALVTIFVDHVPGNPYELFTLRNWGFSDAAEAFFIMSGIAAGLAYSGAFRTKPFLEAAAPIWKRSWTLYVVHIFLTLVGVALFAAGAAYFGLPELLRMNNIGPIFDKTMASLVGVPLLTHQIGYVNILPVYSVMLLAAPFAIRMAMWRPWLLMGCSVLVWYAAGLWRLNFPNFPNPGGWFFNPFSWQLIFVIGLLSGVYMRRGDRFIPRQPWLFALAAGFLVLVLAWRYLPGLGEVLNHQMSLLGKAGAPFHVVSHDKTFVAVPRMLHALALAYVLSAIPAIRSLCGHEIAAPLRLLGRHGLLVFATGTLVSLAMQVMLVAAPNPAIVAWLVLPVGLVVMLGAAMIAERRRDRAAEAAKAAKAAELVARIAPRPGTLRAPGKPAL